LRGQEGTKRTPNQKNVTTTVSHLHDGTVLQFSKILHHILKSAWRNLRLTKKFTLHITGIKPLCWYYTPQEVSEQFVQSLVDRVDVTQHYNEIFKIWFSFSFFFFLCHRNPFDSHTPTRELARQKY